MLIDSGKITSSLSITGSLNQLGNAVISGSMDISGSISSSLPQGHVLVGNALGRTVVAPTSSFGGGSTTDISSLNTFTSSVNTKFTAVQTSTSSLNLFTSSQESKNSTLATYTGSNDTKWSTLTNVTSSILSFTSSQESKNTTLATYTGSNDTKWSTLTNVTSSLIARTSSYATTASNFFNGSQTITGSLIVSSSTAYLQVDGSPNTTVLLVRSGSRDIMLISSSQDVYISGSLTVDVDGYPDNLSPAGFIGNQNNYVEAYVQNFSTGISASSEFTAYADTGGETSSFVHMGINNSGIARNYNPGGRFDSHLLNTGGDLWIGNLTALYQPTITTQSIHLFSNSSYSPDLTISGSRVGIRKSGSIAATLDVFGNISASSGFTGSLLGTASFATSASFAVRNLSTFTKGIAIVNNTGLAATDTGSIPIWRANTACSASLILAYRSGGTGAALNITKNGSNINTASFTTPTADIWISSSTAGLQTQGFNIGDSLAVNLTSFTGSVTEVIVQVEFTSLI